MDSQLSSGATLWVREIFSGFPLVSFHMTDRIEAQPGASVHRLQACLPLHIHGLELTSGNADAVEGRALHYRIRILPRPEAGALRQDKQAGIPGVIHYEPPVTPDYNVRADAEVARFRRAVAQAGGRNALGCGGARIHDAMERADSDE